MPNVRTDILYRADKAVSEDREKEYGSPALNLQYTADFWNTYLEARLHRTLGDTSIEAKDVAILNILQKISRAACGPVGHDTFVDIAGYAALAAELDDVPVEEDKTK